MGALRIPKEHQRIIQDYINLSHEQKEQIISVVKNSEVGLMPSGLASKLKEDLQIPELDTDGITQVLLNLQGAQRKLSLEGEDFHQVLKDTYSKLDNPGFSINQFLDNLEFLLSASGENATATSHVLRIMNENQNVFISSSFNNDIRPIFLNQTSTITGVVIIHNLKITYSTSEEEKEMYFSLDDLDLQSLRASLDLAEKQSQALKSVVDKPFIDIK